MKKKKKLSKTQTRLKSGDNVLVIAGNDKGKEGKIVSLKGNRIIVDGVNQRKKHQKPTQEEKTGKIHTFFAPFHISNVAYSVKGEAVKLRIRVNKEQKKEVYYRKKNKEEAVVRVLN